MPPVLLSDIVFTQYIFETEVELVMLKNANARFISWTGKIILAKFSRTLSEHINSNVFLQLTNKRFSKLWATVTNHPEKQLILANREILLLIVCECNFLVGSIRCHEMWIRSVSVSQIEHTVQRGCIRCWDWSFLGKIDPELRGRLIFCNCFQMNQAWHVLYRME